MRKKTSILIIIFAIICFGTSCLPENQEKYPLHCDGYGYEMGDIVLIDTEKDPEIGDIVIFECWENESCWGLFGPSDKLAEIVGLPEDSVTFTESEYYANGYALSRTTIHYTDTKLLKWGTETIRDTSNATLTVPEDEYLADHLLGNQGSATSLIRYDRYTIRRDAITGVIIKKVGHDNELEYELKNSIY